MKVCFESSGGEWSRPRDDNCGSRANHYEHGNHGDQKYFIYKKQKGDKGKVYLVYLRQQDLRMSISILAAYIRHLTRYT